MNFVFVVNNNENKPARDSLTNFKAKIVKNSTEYNIFFVLITRLALKKEKQSKIYKICN
jgi:hypothetical protein